MAKRTLKAKAGPNKKERRAAERAGRVAVMAPNTPPATEVAQAAIDPAVQAAVGAANPPTPKPKAAKPMPKPAKPVQAAAGADGADGLGKLPALPRAGRMRKPRPTRPCACGCGGETKATWVPGHDARAKGWALRLMRGVISMGDVPEMERVGARRELAILKGEAPKPAPKAVTPKAPKAEKAERKLKLATPQPAEPELEVVDPLAEVVEVVEVGEVVESEPEAEAV